MAGEDWTFWLNMTNLALGIITVLAIVIVLAALSWDLSALWLHKVRKSDNVDIRRVDMNDVLADVKARWGSEPHSLTVPELGLMMADGGEKVETSKTEAQKKNRK